ncbi:DUF2079 domain-containing protein [Streptomyces sp. SKN60]|uniref:DUF2079 domain-containing protein n=1 Tax=Streptomyces sp. SKN60 TaxID=2855506 RepID=UPI002246A28A|nr:DUF2079 domain-containing protein [Streptomyces sp. SKN60]MCX2185687.1 DUF2079 domain-containing protein [Streptomyces sp. SKN60]
MQVFSPALATTKRLVKLLSPERREISAPVSHGTLLAWGIAALCFGLYAALSLSRHQLMLTTGYDLGIFEQAVRSYAHGDLPVAELKGHDYPLLGDHFSPITATIAPFYRVWPSPVTLLLVQAFLLALTVVPLTRWAHRVAGSAGALVIGLGYGVSWGIAQTVGFDFHEVCFAVPLIAFSVEALGNERWRAAVAWGLPLLLVKEDLGLTVAAIGAYIAYRGTRRLGIITAVTGLAGTAVEMLVVIPAFNPDGVFAYFDKVSDSSDAGALDLFMRYTLGLVTPETKLLTLLMLLAPTAFFALRSPLIFIAVPTLAWRFASNNEAYWGTRFHYSAVLMPIIFGAFIHALTSIHRERSAKNRESAVRRSLIVSAAFTVVMLPLFPFAQLAEGATWEPGPRVAVAHHVLDLVPDGATVAASNRLVPQLTNRCTVMVLGLPQNQENPEWVVADTRDPQGWPISREQEAGEVERFREKGYKTVKEEAGYVLLQRM